MLPVILPDVDKTVCRRSMSSAPMHTVWRVKDRCICLWNLRVCGCNQNITFFQNTHLTTYLNVFTWSTNLFIHKVSVWSCNSAVKAQLKTVQMCYSFLVAIVLSHDAINHLHAIILKNIRLQKRRASQFITTATSAWTGLFWTDTAGKAHGICGWQVFLQQMWDSTHCYLREVRCLSLCYFGYYCCSLYLGFYLLLF